MSARGFKRIKIICFIVLLFALNAFVFYWHHSKYASSAYEVSSTNDPHIPNLFSIAAGYTGEKLNKRVETAEALTKQKNAEVWINLLLTDTYIDFNLYGQVNVEKKYYEELRKTFLPFELAIKAAIIRSLLRKPKDSTLWALTSLLDEKEKGKWFREDGFIIKIHADCASPPIREMARDCLKDSLGIDCEWNISAWRMAILARAEEGG
jgi:hypothetical protein